ncbi:MAG: transglycosylase domain-containing protein, partial [Bacteroidales bacterium]|nr:transglycosylase domain-containing protein [Bacteroidales bacterium]
MADDKKEKVSYTKKTKVRIFITLWSLSLLLLIGFVVYFALLSHGVLGYMPTFEELENPKENLATRIYSSDGQLLGTYFRENRSHVRYDSISPNVIDALIATEDVRFYEHCGIDFKSLPRVFKGIVTGNSAKGGGSTISQQLAKMLFPRQKMSKLEFINRKFQEWVIATKLESQYTKEEIITMYLNKFDFLNLAVGIESASRIYFDTIPYGLTKTQAAMLVGMAQNPSMYNPIRFPDKALARRNTVLGQMLKYGKITKEEHDSLVNEPLGIKFRRADHNLGSATYFREFLRLWLSAKKPIRDNYVDEREFIEDSSTGQSTRRTDGATRTRSQTVHLTIFIPMVC